MRDIVQATPKFRDIHISNIVCDGAEEGIFVRGLPEDVFNYGAAANALQIKR